MPRGPIRKTVEKSSSRKVEIPRSANDMCRESLLSFNIHHLQENKIEHRVQQNTDNLIKFHLAYSLHKIEYNTTYATRQPLTEHLLLSKHNIRDLVTTISLPRAS